MKTLTAVFSALVWLSSPAAAVDLAQIPRTILREPVYASQPRYCLLVFGPEAGTRVWLVHDGDTLYADINGNGDLTEANERINPQQGSGTANDLVTFQAGDIQDGDLVHKSLVVGTMNLSHLASSQPQIAAALKKNPEMRFYVIQAEIEMPGRKGNGIGGRVQQAVTAGDTRGALVFANSPEEAPIVHFGGDWEITLFGHHELTVGRTKNVFLGLGTPGLGPGTTAFVGYDRLVPDGRFPKLEVTFAGEGDAAHEHEYTLTHRCCTYNFHGPVRVPDDVSPGEATVTVSFRDWIGGFVTPTTHRVNVVAPKVDLTLEPISPRLKGKLIHLTRDASLHGIRFSPDGKRLIAGDSPGGIVQVWDVETGEQITTIHNGQQQRSYSYFDVAPDWRSVYLPHAQRKYQRIERDGKQLMRWDCSGSIEEWDVATGEITRRLQHSPPRNPNQATLSPDGRYLLTGDEMSGEFERGPERRVSLWDLETGTVRDLMTSRNPYGAFTSDSALVAIEDLEEQFSRTICVFETSTGRTTRKIPIDDKFCMSTLLGFFADSRVLVESRRVFPDEDDYSTSQSSLLFWDVETGSRLDTVAAEEGEIYYGAAGFSPDGKRFGIPNWRGKRGKIFLVSFADAAHVQSVDLGENCFAWEPAFSPDGAWMAASTQAVLENANGRDLTVEDLPQPRIHLIDASTGEIRETMIAPQCTAPSLAFSPDGKTLASGGNGCVLLWDLTTTPGELATE